MDADRLLKELRREFPIQLELSAVVEQQCMFGPHPCGISDRSSFFINSVVVQLSSLLIVYENFYASKLKRFFVLLHRLRVRRFQLIWIQALTSLH